MEPTPDTRLHVRVHATQPCTRLWRQPTRAPSTQTTSRYYRTAQQCLQGGGGVFERREGGRVPGRCSNWQGECHRHSHEPSAPSLDDQWKFSRNNYKNTNMRIIRRTVSWIFITFSGKKAFNCSPSVSLPHFNCFISARWHNVISVGHKTDTWNVVVVPWVKKNVKLSLVLMQTKGNYYECVCTV